MLLSLMVYGTAVTLLLGLGAWMCERAVQGRGFPTRLIWAAALAASVGFAVAVLPWPGGTPPPLEVPSATALGSAPASAAEVTARMTLPVGLDPYLGAGWACLSLLVGALLLRAQLGLAWARSTWTRIEWGERSVFLAEDFGPGVVGLMRAVIVMPRWALERPAHEQELMLQHEAEHRAAGDVRLTWASFGLLTLFPWNAPLWWMVRRLRLAIEIDCDHRVLRRSPTVRPYVDLLVDIAARRGITRAGALTFARPTPFLEWRIRAMTSTPHRRPIRTLGLAVVAGMLVVTACRMDQLPTASPERSVAAADGPYFTPMTVRPELTNRREVVEAAMREYPAAQRDAGISGQALVWFHIDEAGQTVESRLSRSSGIEALDDAALRLARVYEFTGALDGDEPVSVWVQIPITFAVR